MTPSPPVVLLVEDNAADASLLLELLGDLQPPVTTVHCDTGERALGWLEARIWAAQAAEGTSEPCPRLVLMDLRLPGQSGLEILATLRAHPGLGLVPVVILSTSDRQKDVDACHGAGANAYLVKSNDPDELASRLYVAVRLFCHDTCPPSLLLPDH